MEIGLVKETKLGENRIALTPKAVKTIIKAGHQVAVEKDAGVGCDFSNEKYQQVGATIVSTNEAYNQPLVIRVKEPPLPTLRENQTLMGYLHVEKGQSPELLKALLEKNITAYAFEEIRNEQGVRQVNLGFEAGVVGMFEGLRTYGEMQKDNPFESLKPMKEYRNKKEAYKDLEKLKFTAKVCIVGYGNVSNGAQEVLAQLNYLPLILKEEDTEREPQIKIRDRLPTIDILVNAVAWSPGLPRILTEEDLDYMKDGALIIDISCDEEGGIETCKPTSWEDPTYELQAGDKTIIHSCIDNLPSALARNSSKHLSEMILPYVLKVAEGEEISGLMTKGGKFVYKG